MLSINFKKIRNDACVYMKMVGSMLVLVLIYVDDFIIGYNNIDLFEQFRIEIKYKYALKDLGQVNYILGMKVTIDKETGQIHLDNQIYLENLMDKYHIIKTKKTECIPIEKIDIDNLVVENNTCIEQNLEFNPAINTEYRSMVGSVMFAIICTRPELGYSISKLLLKLISPMGKICNINLELKSFL
jgi:N12 class adenine-specific DNA methylase